MIFIINVSKNDIQAEILNGLKLNHSAKREKQNQRNNIE